MENRGWQEKLPWIPEGSFLGKWMSFVEATHPWLVKRNWYEILIVGCAVLAQATKLHILYSRPVPCNFFLALTGSPAAGKSRTLDCVKAVISETWIQDLPTGSMEAMEEALAAYRYGFFMWDEAGELMEAARRGD